MITTMLILFVVGYAFIAFEHKTGINKSAIALLMCGILWSIFSLEYPSALPGLTQTTVSDEILRHLGSTCEILVFLIGAMTIVDLIDFHGGFEFITRRITTRRKVRLLWLVALLTFFMSALLDNMTTTIIMVMLLRKIVPTTKERMLFASVIVIAANSGGACSPIGDVTTIMLWMKGNVSSAKLIESLLLPCLVSLVIPLVIASRWLKGSLPETDPADAGSSQPDYISDGESRAILFLGCALLVAVPVFKSVTALGIMWVFTELMYRRKRNIEESIKCRVAKVLKHIDMSTILFFLGILMAVAALESAGILSGFATGLNEHLHNVYAINTLIGILSSVVDNVPLVAASMGMYPIPDAAAVAASADPTYAAMFVQDGVFWHLLAYCAGVGGSLLIIGSAAGVVAMGLENINFVWYSFRNLARMSGADRADLPKSPPDFRILRGKTNEFMIRIYEATEPSDLLAEAFARLLPQLSERMTAPDREAVARIVASPATRQLVAAAEDGRIVGLLSVALYDVPSGRKAWIEDVVVDAATRGRGIGEALVREALALARREGVARVMLTSNATRRASHRLYERMGFVRYETDCFRLDL